MKRRLTIAIILPVYNTSLYLEECLDSILQQTYANFVLFAINDGSTDKSGLILNHYQSNDKRVRVFNKVNEGVSRTRNFALELVEKENTFDVVCFVDSDDRINKNYLQVLANIFSDSTIDCSLVGLQTFDKKGYNACNQQNHSSFLLNQREGYNFCFALDCYSKKEHNAISQSLCNMAFRASKIYNIRFDENLRTAEDQDYILKALSKSENIFVNNNIFYFYRMRKSSLTHIDKIRLEDIDTYLNWLEKEPHQIKEFHNVIEHMAFQNFWRATRSAALSDKLISIWPILLKKLALMKQSFKGHELKKQRKRILFFNLGPYVTQLYFKLAARQNKINQDSSLYD